MAGGVLFNHSTDSDVRIQMRVSFKNELNEIEVQLIAQTVLQAAIKYDQSGHYGNHIEFNVTNGQEDVLGSFGLRKVCLCPEYRKSRGWHFDWHVTDACIHHFKELNKDQLVQLKEEFFVPS